MSRIVVAPDSFKGTMSAMEVCEIIKREASALRPEAEIICIPMSDGGEGLVSSYLKLIGGQRRSFTVSGPMGAPVSADYGILPNGTAVMEMASCAGLPLMGGKLSPLEASTFGVGELLRHIAQGGCKRVMMGLGGSATNDCGIGMAAALGYCFLDKDGAELKPFAYELHRVERIIPPEKPLDIQVTAACDVNNPLCGDNGSAAVFGPQKGLTPEQIPTHNLAMGHFADIIKHDLNKDVKDVPGAGAAGGLGAGVMAFLDAELLPGVEMLLENVGVDEMMKDALLVVTGEGRIDAQSVSGKVPVGVGRHAKKAGVQCVALCGSIGEGAELVKEHGVTAFYAASEGNKTMEELKLSCFGDIERLARRILPEYL